MSPISATRPTAVTNDTPRNACRASTTEAQRQVGVWVRSWSVRRVTRRSVSSIVSRYSLPVAQRRLVEAWAEIHRAELQTNWERLQSGQPPVKIDPLR
jgi:hypothetical protein